MPEPRTFPLADVLSVTTPFLLSDRDADGLTDLLNWMTGDTLELWQLPRAADEAQPVLIAQHPFLADLQPAKGMRKPELRSWLRDAVTQYGADLPVLPLAAWAHQDPVEEFTDRMDLARLTVAIPPTTEED